MSKLSRLMRWLALPCALFCASIAAADAPTISLRALAGGATVSGKLIEFDGSRYVMETTLGQMVLDASQVSCDGIECPTMADTKDDQSLTLSVGADLSPGLLPHLIEGYASVKNETLVRTLDDDGYLTLRLIGDGQEKKFKSLPQKPGFPFGAVSEGRADVALTLQHPTSDVVAVARANQAAQLQNPEHQQIVALDAATIIVAATNPVRVLSQQQIVDVFAGRIANWSTLGGPNAPIRPILADPVVSLPQSPVADLFQSGKFAATAQILGTAQAVSDHVAADRYAIGLTTYSNLRGATPIGVRGSCGIITAPNPASVLTGAYPFIQRIIAYHGQSTDAPLRDQLAEYLTSETAQDSVTDAGFIGQRVSSISLDGQGQRFVTAMLNTTDSKESALLRAFLGELEQADRLSPTFRFRTGSDVLDQQARADAVRLARYINSRDLSNRELIFVGFTDGLGSPSKNRELSKTRAALVEQQVMALLTPQKRRSTRSLSLGYGKIAPIACDDAPMGQAANRRVEVWLRPQSLSSQ